MYLHKHNVGLLLILLTNICEETMKIFNIHSRTFPGLIESVGKFFNIN